MSCPICVSEFGDVPWSASLGTCIATSGISLDEHGYVSLRALSSSGTSSFTMAIMASITAFNFLGFLHFILIRAVQV